MSARTEKDAVGKALYLEFRREQYTYQIIITPEAPSLDNAKVYNSTVMARRISTYHPRRNWGFAGNPINIGVKASRDAMGAFEPMTEEDAKVYASTRIERQLMSTLNQLAHKGWTLFKNPITVEATYKDMDSIAESKTPNDLIRRINRTRTANGWGEALFNEAPVETV
jgi:hypothetical protein